MLDCRNSMIGGNSPGAQRAAVQPFCTASQLVALLQGVGLVWDVVQLTPGAMRGRFSLNQRKHVAVMTLECDQSLFVCGERNKNYVGVCFDSSVPYGRHVVRGQPIMPCSIYGFNENVSDVFFRTDAGCKIIFVIFKKSRVLTLSSLEGGHHLCEALDSSDSAQLDPKLFGSLRRQVNLASMPGVADAVDMSCELLEAGLLEVFAPTCKINLHSLGSESFRVGLMKELIGWGLQNPHDAITLDHLSSLLFASRTTISHSCREVFGLGPMALLKQIRLQQVQSALSSPELQDYIGLNKVQDIALHYGFQSRNHFARDYRKSFGECPRQTMSRCMR